MKTDEIRRTIAQFADCNSDDLSIYKTPKIYSLHLGNGVRFFGLNSNSKKRWFVVCKQTKINSVGIQNIKRLHKISMEIKGTYQDQWIIECKE